MVFVFCIGITFSVGFTTLLWAALLSWQSLTLGLFDRWQVALRAFQAVVAISLILTAVKAI